MLQWCLPMPIRVKSLLVCALKNQKLHHFRVWLFWKKKILIGYSQLYTPDENKQVRNMHIAYYWIKFPMWCHRWCPCLVILVQCGWTKWSSSVILVENPLSGELVLSDFDQSNLRRGYDGKCQYCPRVWFEFSGGILG